MSDYNFNFGPPWFWKVLAALCIVGALTILAAIIAVIVWVGVHVRFI